ncbi:hypothetical protein HD806DRAFT_5738 [Xylariaceae sp. AK1471]|nr:hypothetical protein HD806DRAFT_5738 [Xylariaceae sp. AK1471]
MVGLGKWKLGSRQKQSTASSGNSETTSSATDKQGSGSSSSSSSSNTSSAASSPTSSPASSSPRLSWFRSLSPHHQSSPKKSLPKKKNSIISRDDPAFARLHKPFTPQNLEHQKLLSAFEWNSNNFDDNRHRRWSDASGLSPCASRRVSVVDYGEHGYDYYGVVEHGYEHGQDHMLPPNSLARVPTREAPAEESDLEKTT